MADAKHTRGPWIWADDHQGLFGAGPDNAVLQYGHYEGMWLGYERQDANARLIAAAPDLLEALEEAQEFVEAYVDVTDGPNGQPEPNRAMLLAQLLAAAIAKATGASS